LAAKGAVHRVDLARFCYVQFRYNGMPVAECFTKNWRTGEINSLWEESFMTIRTGRQSRIAIPALAALAGALFASGALAQECEVKIGMAGALTGGASAWGLAMKAGAEFQAALANEAGGLEVGNRKCKVKVVSVDAQCTAAGGAAASNYLASENVRAVVGPICSPETTGFQPVSKRYGQLYMSSSYKVDVIGAEWPLGFHQLQGPLAWGPRIIKEAKDRFKFASVLVMGPNDQGGTDAGNQLVAMYKGAGVAATPEWYQRGTTNFGPLVTRVISQKPDAVELAAMPPPDVTNFVKQMTEAGFAGVFGGSGGIGMNPVVQGAGGVDKLKGYYWLELMPVEDPGAVKLREDFQRVMKVAPPDNGILYTASYAAEQYLKAISIAGTDSDPDKIADALRKLTPESRYFGKGGWRGKTQYGINQELAFPVGMGVIADGKKVGVLRIELPAE
jgi:branched-chain amino acid transport system substrate-binding protein